MRSHAEIIKAAVEPGSAKTGPHALARILHPHVGGDLAKLQNRVRAWQLTDSIPGEYWALIERLGVSEVVELAEYAEDRRIRTKVAGVDPAEQEAAA